MKQCHSFNVVWQSPLVSGKTIFRLSQGVNSNHPLTNLWAIFLRLATSDLRPFIIYILQYPISI